MLKEAADKIPIEEKYTDILGFLNYDPSGFDIMDENSVRTYIERLQKFMT